MKNSNYSGSGELKSSYFLEFDPNKDPTDVLQAKINELQSSKKSGVIFIPSGTYRLRHTIKITSSGISLVGLRSADNKNVAGKTQFGSYPTFNFDDNFCKSESDQEYCSDYTKNILSVFKIISELRDKGSKVDVNGKETRSDLVSFSGLYGININYIGDINSQSKASKATALLYDTNYLTVAKDITIKNAYRGILIIMATNSDFRNLAIYNVRGDYGIRVHGYTINGNRAPKSPNIPRIHGAKIVASSDNKVAKLLWLDRYCGGGDYIGLDLAGGAYGIHVDGFKIPENANSFQELSDPVNSYAIANVFMRSIIIRNPAVDGLYFGFSYGVYVNDLTVQSAGQFSLNISRLYRAGFHLTNFRSTFSGASAIYVGNGESLSVSNAVLLNSGKSNTKLTKTQGITAGIYVDEHVTGFTLGGGRIGSTSKVNANENFGIYVNSVPGKNPSVVAGAINFLDLAPGAIHIKGAIEDHAKSFSDVISDFLPLEFEKNWPQSRTTNPIMTGANSVVRGYNIFALPEIEERVWINISTPGLAYKNNQGVVSEIISSSQIIGKKRGLMIDSDALNNLIKALSKIYPKGVVLYFPKNSYFVNQTIEIRDYSIQFLGENRNATEFFLMNSDIPGFSFVTEKSRNSGLHSLGIEYVADNILIGSWKSPPIKAADTRYLRFDGLTIKGRSGGFSLVDVNDSDIFDVLLKMGIPQSQAPIRGISILARKQGSSQNIRIARSFGGFMQGFDKCPADHPRAASGCGLPCSEIPSLDWIHLAGGVEYVQIDYVTFIEGMVALATSSSQEKGYPKNISSYKLAIDHGFCEAIKIQKAENLNFTGLWMGGRDLSVFLGSEVTGKVRIDTSILRGSSGEGMVILGGDDVAIVNTQIGINQTGKSSYKKSNRPKAGLFLGEGVKSARLVGGVFGDLFNADITELELSSNKQDWGVAIDMPKENFQWIGASGKGNLRGPLCQRTKGKDCKEINPAELSK